MFVVMKKILALALLLALLIPLPIAQAEADQTTLEFDFLSRLLTIDEETLAALTGPDATEAHQAYALWLSEAVGEIASPELTEELFASRLLLPMLGDAVSLCVGEIHVENLDPDTAGSGRCKFTVLADAVLSDGTAGTLTFFGRLTKDEAAGQIAALRLNRMP